MCRRRLPTLLYFDLANVPHISIRMELQQSCVRYWNTKLFAFCWLTIHNRPMGFDYLSNRNLHVLHTANAKRI